MASEESGIWLRWRYRAKLRRFVACSHKPLPALSARLESGETGEILGVRLSFAERLGELPFSLMYYHDIWTEGTIPCRTVTNCRIRYRGPSGRMLICQPAICCSTECRGITP